MFPITVSQLQIGEVAKRAGVSIRTVRYYDEKGLLPPSSYTSAGIRLYTVKDVNRLIFIRRLKGLGLSIEKIKLYLGEIPESSDIQKRAERTIKLLRMQKKKTREEMARLTSLEKEIDESINRVAICMGCKAAECPEPCPLYGCVL
ncbi:MAG: MerR family transcriptional regulator [Dehalococcoidia bacterium]|nr:MerR family transcriptional regulator [Dehalococcoidia bacterium]MDD5494554.1 MerR family transcriptional regulator [Dehalococcoidia bacterium]